MCTSVLCTDACLPSITHLCVHYAPEATMSVYVFLRFWLELACPSNNAWLMQQSVAHRAWCHTSVDVQ